MMTVEELIAHLEKMPQEAKVELEILGIPDNYSADDVDEIYETSNNTVCIQAYNF